MRGGSQAHARAERTSLLLLLIHFGMEGGVEGVIGSVDEQEGEHARVELHVGGQAWRERTSHQRARARPQPRRVPRSDVLRDCCRLPLSGTQCCAMS